MSKLKNKEQNNKDQREVEKKIKSVDSFYVYKHEHCGLMH